MGKPLCLDPFSILRDMSFGRPPGLLVFRHRVLEGGRDRVQLHLFDRRGAPLAVLEGLADLTADGEGVVGLLLGEDGGSMALFGQPAGLAQLSPAWRSANLPVPLMARLHRLGGDLWLITGARGALPEQYLVAARQGAQPVALSVVGQVDDPQSAIALATMTALAGTAVLDGRILVGCQSAGLPDHLGRAPLAVETADLWQSRRLVEGGAPVGDGPVFWRTTAVCAWGGAFWIAASRATAQGESHRLFRMVPGEAAVEVAETGSVAMVDGLGQPRGVMIRAGGEAAPTDPTTGLGGLWPGDRLVMTARRCRGGTPQAPLLAPGADGVLVIGAQTAPAPAFFAAPAGHAVLAAYCLGAPDQSDTPAEWLLTLSDGAGGLKGAISRDFVDWRFDGPAGAAPPPASEATLARFEPCALREA
ncbi:hypothetical protein F11_13250 [Rhodospirillum rubrum F11]|uniref:Uncharacterized protein n=1 Tax=Rhodospirillum rubrum (strain ATCC 11170 / ATH 1.1.1 / DSM 467 / LMG 4362 / NCIMB 8255 / S1) TaxID=269796 RepID=Q2RR68_RHORT|nr:hypothetical protein [Rhodospirillum rubrum]ABC23377.1 hypothetical protein Rru_A2580 [Rhodospirillum rubrum ATCC 11170]AEO49112.1 hypothetical protein F11_13250 [Rhodospirillum rubrum F11]MBK5955022.1 hypothetical protein [Rhodospirillum rubrum]QXG79350.1 hypothetical protein KUL73_13310 [Rhodospirillum rubrum]